MRFLFISLTLLVAFSCGKSKSEPKGPPPCDPETHIKITDQRFLDFVFKQGSFWVYKDSLDTNFHDTLHFEYPMDFVDVANSPYYTCTYIQIYRMRGWSKYMVEQTDRDYIIKPDSFFTISSYQQSPIAAMYVPKGTPGNPCKFYDSLFIYNQYYKNVVQSDTIRGSNGITFKMICYFNSDFGFLRNDLYSTSNQLISRKYLYSKNIVK